MTGRSILLLALDGFRPDRWDVVGALARLGWVGVIRSSPRAGA